MISKSSLFAVIALALSRNAVATWAGCYDASVLDGVSADSIEDIGSVADCSSYCSSSNFTTSFFAEPTADSQARCTCSNASPPPTALLQASGTSSSPSCSPEQITATYSDTSLSFNSCSYAASTTAQYIPTANSTTTCFEDCSAYPVTYIYPGAGGWNCYCAMTANGAGAALCGDNTFYAYTKDSAGSRSRR